MKHILFLLGRFGIGGVERVTVTVANELALRGWRVSVAAFEIQKESLIDSLDKCIAVETLSFPAYRWRNIRRLHQILHMHEIDVVINQWALPFPVTLMLRFAMKKGTKLVAFHHTMPSRNNRIALANGGVKAWCWQKLSALNLRLVYRFSDAYVVLSESFKAVFSDFTGLKKIDKIRVIPNPVVVKSSRGSCKENLILYVGRLSQSEKRVDRVIEVWKRIQERLPDWRLEILGDGPDRALFEEMARDLPRISFLGFQNPSTFYERSKLLLLTSDFEGFGLVLLEAMAHGCVPVVYGSFPSVHDIVDDWNGIVVPMPWDADRFAQQVLKLATAEEHRQGLSNGGRKSILKFSMDEVLKKYERLFVEV